MNSGQIHFSPKQWAFGSVSKPICSFRQLLYVSMKNYLSLFLLVFYVPLSCNYLIAQECLPLASTDNLAVTKRPLKEIIGINAGYEIEHFTKANNFPLEEVGELCSIIRFFYQQDKDYDGIAPKDIRLGDKTKEELITDSPPGYLWDNYIRIEKIKEAGLKVAVAIEISVRNFPDKWWRKEELGASIKEIQATGKDWTCAFLRVYDPKTVDGTFPNSPPLVDILELGNEPWGDPGITAYQAYIQGIILAFDDYYGVTKPRIGIAGAAYQAHELKGSTYGSGHLGDAVNIMVGGSNQSKLRAHMTEGVGVHNYNFSDYRKLDVHTIQQHPEATNGGFNIYKNVATWVNQNMPFGNRKVNATEFGWNSDDEPGHIFECHKANQWGGCQEANFSNTIALSMPGCTYNYGTNECGKAVKIGIGRTAQAAYIIRSILLLHSWGANQAVIYNLMDDWTNGAYYSNGLVDTNVPSNVSELKTMLIRPKERKEAWYALQKMNQLLGDQYFLGTYGTAKDNGIYVHIYGDAKGRPKNMVAWRAVDLGKLSYGKKNMRNSSANITVVENQVVPLNVAQLGCPSNVQIDINGKTTYLDGRNPIYNRPTTELYRNGQLWVSSIPIVIPLR